MEERRSSFRENAEIGENMRERSPKLRVPCRVLQQIFQPLPQRRVVIVSWRVTPSSTSVSLSVSQSTSLSVSPSESKRWCRQSSENRTRNAKRSMLIGQEYRDHGWHRWARIGRSKSKAIATFTIASYPLSPTSRQAVSLFNLLIFGGCSDSSLRDKRVRTGNPTSHTRIVRCSRMARSPFGYFPVQGIPPASHQGFCQRDCEPPVKGNNDLAPGS